MIIKVNLAIIRLSVAHPRRNDLLEFYHAWMLQVLDHVIHLLQKRDPFLQTVFFGLVGHRVLI